MESVGAEPDELTLWVTRFLETRAGEGVAHSTMLVARRNLEALVTWMRRHRASLASLTPQRLATFASLRRGRLIRTGRQRGRTLSAMTFLQELGVLRLFFRYLIHHDVILLDPAAGLSSSPSRVRCARGVFTPAEVMRILDTLDGDRPRDLRDRAALSVLYGAGLRLGEAGALDVSDYDPDERHLWIRRAKGNKARLVPLGPVAAQDVDAYLERGRPSYAMRHDDGALFLNRYGLRLSTTAIYVRLQAIQRAVRIEPVRGAHALRHACATHMLLAGADVRHLQELLGHADLATTALYTHVDLADLRAALARAHPHERRPGRR